MSRQASSRPAVKGKGNAPAKAAKPRAAGKAPAPQQGAPERQRAACACGGGCPRCQDGEGFGKRRRGDPPRPSLRQPARLPETGAAEREALRLAPRMLEVHRAARAGPEREVTTHERGQTARPAMPHAAAPANKDVSSARARAPPAGQPSTTARQGSTATIRGPPRGKLRPSAPPGRRLRSGRRLTCAQSAGFGEALDFDLSPVRLHYGPYNAALAGDRQALAFTYGTHIVLGRAAQNAAPDRMTAILAHELIHVVQQSATTEPVPARAWEHPLPRGPPVRPLLRTPLSPQNLDLVPDWAVGAASAVGSAGSYVYHGAVDLGADAIEAGVELGGDVVDFALEVGGVILEGAEEVVDYFAPGLLDFLRGDFLDDLQEMFCDGLDALVSTLLDPLSDIDIMTGLESVFRGITAGVQAVYSGLGSVASAAVGIALWPMLKVIEVFGDDIISVVQSLSDGVSTVFTTVWENIAVPVLDFLGDAASGVWEVFTDLVTWIWDLAEPVRDAASWAWDWLMKQFGLAWQNTSGVRAWLEEKAKAAWKAFLELIEPIKEPLMIAGGILLFLSPLGPIIVLTQVLPPIWEKLTWLAANWHNTAIVVWARETLEQDILPAIIGAVDMVKAFIMGATAWFAGMVAAVARGVQAVLGIFGANSCLASVNRVLKHIADQFDRLQIWAESGFQGLEAAVGQVFDTLRAIFQPILDFLVRLAMVAANPPMLPVAIAGAVWLLLPDTFKPPVINFVLDLLIAFLPGMAAFLSGLGPMVFVLKAAAIGFLRHLRSGEGIDDAARINASNKIANLMAGGGPAFVLGYAIGLLHGLIDGIIDPFKLLFMLFELIVTGIRVLGRVLAPYLRQMAPEPVAEGLDAFNAAMAVPAAAGKTTDTHRQEGMNRPEVSNRMARGPPPEMAKQITQTTAPDAGRRTITAVTQNGGQAEAAAGEGTVTSTLTRGLPQAATAQADASVDTAEDSGGAEMSEEDAVFATGDVAPDAEIAQSLSPGLIASVAGAAPPEGVSAAGLETEMRAEVQSEGSTVSGLGTLLGDAWDWMMDGAGRLGRYLAGKFMELLALSDYRLGRKIGWLSGMILFELLLAYFTAGGYTVIKQGASLGRRLLAYLLRFLDLGGEILGVLGKALAPLKGPILRGLGATRSFLSRFGFMRRLFDQIEGFARTIFRFGDEAATAGSHAPTPRAPDVPTPRAPDVPARTPDAPARAPDAPPAGRAAGETADQAGDRAAREVLDDPPTRPASEAAQDLPDGGMRAVDEPGVPRVSDDAAKAAQIGEAMIAARTIAESNDAIDTPLPLTLGQLIVLKRRYRWIDTFQAKRLGAGVYRLDMVASTNTIDPHHTPGGPGGGTPPASASALDNMTPAQRQRFDQLVEDFGLDASDPNLRRLFDENGADDALDMVENYGRRNRPTPVSRDADMLQGRPDPNAPVTGSDVIPQTRTQVHTSQTTRLGRNRVFGQTREELFTPYIHSGPLSHQFDHLGTQVRIRPLIPDGRGGLMPAGYTVIPDNLGRNRATGDLIFFDVKPNPGIGARGPRALGRGSFTTNQKAGYPMIQQHGGVIEVNGIPGLARGTRIGPADVQAATPSFRINDPNVTPQLPLSFQLRDLPF